MGRPTRIEINTQNLAHNLNELKRLNRSAFFCPMVKANAYGHGLNLIAPVIERVGVDMMGVALLEEGVALRQIGVQTPILVFAPVMPGDAETIFSKQLTPVVGRLQDLVNLSREAAGKPLGVHLKFNTGMQRLGLDVDQLDSLKEGLQKNSNLRVEGLCTQLTHGDDILNMDGPSHRQFQQFFAMCGSFPGVRHVHKSATLAMCGTEKSFADVGARPGISIYGLPYEGELVAAGLKAVLRWTTELINVHSIAAGQAVSYGSRWVAPRRSTIGVVPLGYGDGYSRSQSNKGYMLFRGMKVPIVGNICMDYILLDLTSASSAGLPKTGEPVVVIGQQGEVEISVGELAKLNGTIAYEIVTGISDRVKRVVI